MEIISGRPAVDFDLEHGEHYLVQKVTTLEQPINQYKVALLFIEQPSFYSICRKNEACFFVCECAGMGSLQG